MHARGGGRRVSCRVQDAGCNVLHPCSHPPLGTNARVPTCTHRTHASCAQKDTKAATWRPPYPYPSTSQSHSAVARLSPLPPKARIPPHLHCDRVFFLVSLSLTLLPSPPSSSLLLTIAAAFACAPSTVFRIRRRTPAPVWQHSSGVSVATQQRRQRASTAAVRTRASGVFELPKVAIKNKSV